MNKTLCLTALWILASAGMVWAGQPLTPLQAFKQSDAIALIRVREIGPQVGGNGKYAQTARVEVYDAIKGCKDQDFLDLDFDTGSPTANVLYSIDERAVVILRRLPTGHYETLHDYCGKFIVEQGEVLDCYLLGEPGKVPPSIQIDEAARRLRVLVAETKDEE